MKDITKDDKFVLKLLYKSHLFALDMENNFKLLDKGHSISSDLKEWGYYRNLSGYPHRFNSRIYFSSPVDNSKTEITKEYLDNNPDIREYILNTWDVLYDLMLRYPGDNTYIMGMLTPTDIDRLIEAKDGTILYYDSNDIQYYEENLKSELEAFISDFLFNYQNPGYITTDNLYCAGLRVVLYQALILKVKELRYRKQQYYSVSDELMNLTFDSNLYIARLLDGIDRNIRLWIYKNIKYLTYNIGKDSTIDILIENVIKKLGFALWELVLKPTNMKLLDSNSDSTNQIKIFNTLNLKDRINKRDDTPITYESIYKSEKEILKDRFYTKYFESDILLYKYDKMIRYDRGIFERSKHFILASFENFNPPVGYERMVLDSLFILLLNSLDSKFTVKIKDREQQMSGLNILILTLFYLEQLTGKELILDTIAVSSIFIKQDNDELIKGIYDSEEIRDIYNGIVEDINSHILIAPDDVIDINSLTAILEQNVICYNRLYGHMTLLNNGIFASNIELIYKRFRKRVLFTLPDDIRGRKLEDVIVEKNLRYRDNSITGIDEIIKSLFGFSLIENVKNKIGLNITEFMNRMTSYTVNFIYDTIETDLLLPHITVESLSGINAITINDFTYDCMGTKPTVTAFADDNRMDIIVLREKDTLITVDRELNRPDLAIEEFSGVRVYPVVDREIRTRVSVTI